MYAYICVQVYFALARHNLENRLDAANYKSFMCKKNGNLIKPIFVHQGIFVKVLNKHFIM